MPSYFRDITLVTGARIQPGFGRETAAPIAWDGKPYDAKSLTGWRKAFLSKMLKFSGTIIADLETLIKIAEWKGCLVPFMWAVQIALGDPCGQFLASGRRSTWRR
jgi:hypothetical protein